MPDYSENKLTISGPNEDVEAFIQGNTGTSEEADFIALDFRKAAPEDEERLSGEEYDWYYANWGTKWNAIPRKLATGDLYSDGETLTDVTDFWDIQEMEAVLKFDTAWTPPIAWLEKAAEKHPNLYFILEYTHEADAFQGVAEGKGLDIEDDYWNLVDEEPVE